MVKQTFSHNHTQRNTCPIQWRWPWSRKMPWNIGELQDINGMTFIKSTLLIVSTKRKHVCGKILMGPVSMSRQSFKMGFLILVRWHLKTLRCTPDGTKPLLDLNMTSYQWLCFVFIFNVLLIKIRDRIAIISKLSCFCYTHQKFTPQVQVQHLCVWVCDTQIWSLL